MLVRDSSVKLVVALALAVTSLFVWGMLFRHVTETERQQNTTTEVTWTLSRSQEQ